MIEETISSDNSKHTPNKICTKVGLKNKICGQNFGNVATSGNILKRGFQLRKMRLAFDTLRLNINHEQLCNCAANGDSIKKDI